MKFSTYNSLLTGRRTWFIASIGRCGQANYKEIQVICEMGKFHWRITDGYSILKTGHHNENLKSALNIAEGYCKDL